MDPKKIERINKLARKKKTTGLTEAEAAEQAADVIGNNLTALHPLHRELLELMFACVWFSRVGRMFKEETYRTLIEPEGSDGKLASVRLWCFDPSRHILSTFNRVRGAALFSATLTPLEFYARQTGLKEEEGDALLQLDSPFPRKNLLVLRLPVVVVIQSSHAMSVNHRYRQAMRAVQPFFSGTLHRNAFRI